MLRSFEGLRQSMLAAAIRKNVVREPTWRARMNNQFVRWAMSQQVIRLPEIPRKRLYENPEQNPLTQKSWENTHPDGLLTAPAGTVPWIVELARISVPQDYVGVCKSFEQVLIHPDIQDPITFSLSGNWGNPFLLPAGVTVTWHFRVERSDQGEPGWINASSPTPLVLLPGEPHFDVSEMQDLWFGASSPPSQNFHMTIGSRYRMRVLAIVERDDEYAIQIAAKIRGFTLSCYDPMTLLAIRSIW